MPDAAPISVRRAREGDARLLVAWSAMPEARRFQPLPPLALSAMRRLLRRCAATSLAEQRGRMLRWLIEEDGIAAGWVTLRDIDWTHRTATLAYVVAPWAQGRGVATAGAAQVLDLAFRVGRLERIEATCDIDHAASIRVLEKLGFRREGTLRSVVSMPQGRRDHHVYGLLRPPVPG
jgi:RimJ/RimL family protein N-acetyltransferase